MPPETVGKERDERCFGITERAAHRIVGELAAAGYISRKRNGRRNRNGAGALQAH